MSLYNNQFSQIFKHLHRFRIPTLQALASKNIGVANGEACSNKVMFKQFLQSGAVQFCQIDSCRIASINEILAVYFMARKFNGTFCSLVKNSSSCKIYNCFFFLSQSSRVPSCRWRWFMRNGTTFANIRLRLFIVQNTAGTIYRICRRRARTFYNED